MLCTPILCRVASQVYHSHFDHTVTKISSRKIVYFVCEFSFNVGLKSNLDVLDTNSTQLHHQYTSSSRSYKNTKQ